MPPDALGTSNVFVSLLCVCSFTSVPYLLRAYEVLGTVGAGDAAVSKIKPLLLWSF